MDPSEANFVSQSTEDCDNKNPFTGSPIFSAQTVASQPPVISLDSHECPSPPVLPLSSDIPTPSDIPTSSDIFTAEEIPTSSDLRTSVLPYSSDAPSHPGSPTRSYGKRKCELCHLTELECEQWKKLVKIEKERYHKLEQEYNDVKGELHGIFYEIYLKDRQQQETMKSLRREVGLMEDNMKQIEALCGLLKRKYEEGSE